MYDYHAGIMFVFYIFNLFIDLYSLYLLFYDTVGDDFVCIIQ